MDIISIMEWKPFTDAAIKPHWIRQKKKVPKVPAKVAVTACLNGWCPE